MPRISLTLALAFGAPPLLAQATTGTIRVSTAGSDAGNCGSAVAPCRNPQRAVTLSAAGDQILVAAGVYTFQAGLDPCSTSGIGATAVVCALNKPIVLRGGYDGASWASPAFGPDATVIDGQGSRRGVLVEDTAGLNRAAVTLENLTVANGRGTARTAGAGDALIFGFGGGLDSTFAATVVRDVVFRDNLALGTASGGAYGGTGSGGAVSLRAVPAGSLLERVVFLRNEARGGAGAQRGGYAVGGAVFSYRSSYTGSDWTLLDNLAQAGSSAGSGVAGGQKADGLGGAVAFQLGTQATVERLVAHGNEARGGAANATSGSAGGAFGGALFAEGAGGADATAVTLRDLRLEWNVARGAAAGNGGYGSGGGFHTIDAGVVLERARVVGNQALGGNGTAAGSQGPAGGGGAAFTRTTPAVTALVRDSLFAANSVVAGAVGSVVGGGGGGLWLQGLGAVVRDSTLVDNWLGQSYLQGHAMVLLAFVSGADVELQYSVVSDHVTPAGPHAVHVQAGSTIHFEPSLFAANGSNTNQGQAGAGTFLGAGSIQTAGAVGYLSPGAPQHNYRLAIGSPAADPGSGSSAALDLDRALRDGNPDFGAHELSAGRIFLDGFESGGTEAWQ